MLALHTSRNVRNFHFTFIQFPVWCMSMDDQGQLHLFSRSLIYSFVSSVWVRPVRHVIAGDSIYVICSYGITACAAQYKATMITPQTQSISEWITHSLSHTPINGWHYFSHLPLSPFQCELRMRKTAWNEFTSSFLLFIQETLNWLVLKCDHLTCSICGLEKTQRFTKLTNLKFNYLSFYDSFVAVEFWGHASTPTAVN